MEDVQISAGKFELPSALSLLRLYNLLPDQMDLKLVGNILVQALLRLPEPDFNLAMLLIPERMQVLLCNQTCGPSNHTSCLSYHSSSHGLFLHPARCSFCRFCSADES